LLLRLGLRGREEGEQVERGGERTGGKGRGKEGKKGLT